MIREKVGAVTEQEKDEVMELCERKNALKELLVMLENNLLDFELTSQLYNKIIADLQKSSLSINQWWKQKSQKYKWKSEEKGEWTINFNTNEIFLIIS